MTTETIRQGNIQLEHADHRIGVSRYPLCLLAQDIVDPANVGSLFRIADALGVEHLYLTGQSSTPPNTKVRRTARMAERHVSWTYAADALALVRELKARGDWILSLELTSSSIDVRTLRPPKGRRVILILGAEKSGVSQALLDESAQTVHIPMRGHNSSMNVAVAGALAVFELSRELATD